MNHPVSTNHYLEATVKSASPARLRLMLLERSVDVAARLSHAWKTGESRGSNEHSIRLLDLLTELLAGVQGGVTKAEQALCDQVADLYVFLSQHLVAAEADSDSQAIDEIKLVLETEAETWRAVCAQSISNQPPTIAAGGLNLQG